MTPVRNLSKTQLQLIERLRVSPVPCHELVPEYASTWASLKSQISMIRRYAGIDIKTRDLGFRVGSKGVNRREYYLG